MTANPEPSPATTATDTLLRVLGQALPEAAVMAAAFFVNVRGVSSRACRRTRTRYRASSALPSPRHGHGPSKTSNRRPRSRSDPDPAPRRTPDADRSGPKVLAPPSARSAGTANHGKKMAPLPAPTRPSGLLLKSGPPDAQFGDMTGASRKVRQKPGGSSIAEGRTFQQIRICGARPQLDPTSPRTPTCPTSSRNASS